MSDTDLPRLDASHRSLVSRILQPRRIPGAAVGVVRGGALTAFEGFGVAGTNSNAAPTPDSLYRVASITKTITATAIMRLRDAGRLDLDDPLERHLPEFEAVKARRGSRDQVTFRRMLAHHSGLMSDARRDYWEDHDFPSMPQILDELDRIEVVLEPDRASKYSNLAFALMGEVISRHAGVEYTQHVRESILDPIGMRSSAFELDADLTARLATGYDESPYSDDVQPAPHRALEGLTAAGQLYSSVADLARWIGFQLQVGPAAVSGTEVLAPSTIEEMHRPQFLDPGWKAGHCLGWQAVRHGDEIHIGHTGSLPGYRCAHYFNKAAGIGVVVLTNRGWHNGAPQAALALLDALVADSAAEAPSEMARPGEAPPPAIAPLLGLYSFHGIPALRVEFRGGELRLEAADPAEGSLHAPAKLRPTDDLFVFEVEGGRGAGEFGRFRRDEAGEVVAFALGGAVYWRMATQRGH